MKTIGIRVNEMKAGGFFKGGFARIAVVVNDNGKETNLGEWGITTSSLYKVRRELSEIKKEFEKKGYRAIGQWDLS